MRCDGGNARAPAPVVLGLVVGLAAGLLAHGPAAAAGTQPVTSLLEMRQAGVVIQKWDLSCGAAALTTLLNYQHGERLTEREVAIALMGRPEYIEDPSLLQERQGFSLLDLERYVAQLGYQGTGYGQLTFEYLVEKAPIITPVQLHGYSHFVVFRGVANGRVLLADPAYGNRTMPRERFEQAWIQLGDLGRVGFVVERRDGLIPPNRLAPRPEEFVILH